MNGNGAATSDTAYQRFLSLAQRVRGKSVSREDAPPRQLTEQEIRAGKLESWLREPPAEDCIVWIDSLIAIAGKNAHASLKEHAEVARWLGVQEGLGLLLDEMLRIRGQAS